VALSFEDISRVPHRTFELRSFRWQDVPAITEIYAHYVRNSVVTFDIEAPGEAAIADKYGRLVEARYPVVIAEHAGELLGFAYASAFRPRPAYRLTCEDTVYLDPEATRRGVGSALLEQLIIESQAAGFKQMIAIITAGTTASIALHEKFGFRTLGQFPGLGYKFDRWLDIVHMQRAL
jgi:L-amino acid N-acyltransferase YncA